MSRPRIAIPGRFTESASAIRYQGLVSARRLLEAVWAAGGDPVVLLPTSGPDACDWSARLEGFDGVLLPGGGDIRPTRYGMPDTDPSLYDMDDAQDESDFTLARYCLDNGVPMLAVCRGLHVVNALLGGTLIIDMDVHHRHHVHEVTIDDPNDELGFGGSDVTCSCYHHQAIDQVAEGVVVLGRADDGVVEAVSFPSTSWAVGLQWHPEDTYDVDAAQLLPFRRLVTEAAKR